MLVHIGLIQDKRRRLSDALLDAELQFLAALHPTNICNPAESGPLHGQAEGQNVT